MPSKVYSRFFIDGRDLIPPAAFGMTVTADTFAALLARDGAKLSALGEAAMQRGREVARQYELEVEGLLVTINGTATGKTILNAIKAKSRTVRIMPWVKTDWNATAAPTDATAAWKKDNWFFKGGQDDPSTPRDDRFDPQVKRKGNLIWADTYWTGTGTGSDVVVRFTPSMFGANTPAGKLPKSGGASGFEPDEVLFHELVHAYRQVRGQMFQLPQVGAMANYHDLEEFYGVLIANVYMAERGKTAMRRDHDGFKTLPARLTAVNGFLTDPTLGNDHTILIAEFAKGDPATFAALSQIRSAWFNPFRDMADMGYATTQAILSLFQAKPLSAGGPKNAIPMN